MCEVQHVLVRLTLRTSKRLQETNVCVVYIWPLAQVSGRTSQDVWYCMLLHNQGQTELDTKLMILLVLMDSLPEQVCDIISLDRR